MENSRKIWFDQNDQPPKNYIWYKNGQYLEWNGEKWVASTGMNGISSDMTEEQKMEARKNLGLYYEETSVGEKTVEYNGEEMSFQDFGNWAKVSNDTPAKTDIVSIAGNPVSDEINVGFHDETDGYQIYPIGAPSGTHFRIVLNDSEGHQPGIYYDTIGAEYASMVPLVYKGETTTIHKIDAKFLPEQEGGSSLKWLDVTSLPSTDGDEVDISSNISQSDYNDLLDGKYIGIRVPRNAFGIEFKYTILHITRTEGNVAYPCIALGEFRVIGFDADDIIKNIIYLIGTNVTSMYIRNVTLINEVPEPVVLSALPETSITTQIKLDVIGLSAANVQKLVNGEAPALCLSSGAASGSIATRLNLEYATYLADNNFSLKFSTNTEKYEVANAFGTITVTKTSLS